MTYRESAAPASSNELTTKLAGADAHAAQFSGSLEDLSVADLIQILQLAGKSASIVVTEEGSESRLWCVAGEIVDAESGRLRGEAAVHRILGLERGWMKADLRSPARTRSIFAGTQRLLLEAARRKDESVALRRKLGEPQRCYRLADGVAADQLGLGPRELCLLRSFTDVRSLEEVFESSELGDFETVTALAAWVDAGQLVEAGLRPARRPAAPALIAAGPTPIGTLRPLVASVRTRPAPRSQSGALSVPRTWGVIAALVLTPAGYLLGSLPRHAPESTAAPALLPAAAAPAENGIGGFEVALHVEPPEAEIWLDGEQSGVGQLDTELARDGVPHELRVEAPGFQPLRILFVDTPPPLEVVLEPDGADRRAAAADATPQLGRSAPPGAPPTASPAPKARKRPLPPRAPLRHEPPRPGPRARTHAAAGGGLREASARQSAASSTRDPIVRVLD